jgi:hypothetical protein
MLYTAAGHAELKSRIMGVTASDEVWHTGID